MEIPSLVLAFANYQRIVMFQISSNQNPIPWITEPDFSYMRLHENNCNISLSLQKCYSSY